MTETKGANNPDKKPTGNDGNSRNKGRFKKKETSVPTKEKFKGRTTGLEGRAPHDCAPGSNQSDNFIKTTKEVAECSQMNCDKHPADISKLVSDLQEPNIPLVPRPTPITPAPPLRARSSTRRALRKPSLWPSMMSCRKCYGLVTF